MLQPSHVFEAEGEQLRTLKLALSPWRPHVAIALATMLQGKFLRNALGDIYFALETINAGIRRVWDCHNTAHTASYHLHLEHRHVDGLSTACQVFLVGL